jgi:hypothetical protein
MHENIPKYIAVRFLDTRKTLTEVIKSSQYLRVAERAMEDHAATNGNKLDQYALYVEIHSVR